MSDLSVIGKTKREKPHSVNTVLAQKKSEQVDRAEDKWFPVAGCKGLLNISVSGQYSCFLSIGTRLSLL